MRYESGDCKLAHFVYFRQYYIARTPSLKDAYDGPVLYYARNGDYGKLKALGNQWGLAKACGSSEEVGCH